MKHRFQLGVVGAIAIVALVIHVSFVIGVFTTPAFAQDSADVVVDDSAGTVVDQPASEPVVSETEPPVE